MNLSLRAVIACWICLAPLAELTAEPMAAPVLGAASNFGQGWHPQLFESAYENGVTDFRDAVYWRLIEAENGGYEFTKSRTNYPEKLGPNDQQMSLTVNNGHPGYDGGHTPISPEGVAAFARFAARAVEQFPAIHSVEVGNEMNSETFVSGPGWDVDLETRAVSYAALLKETAAQVRKVNPEARILGGAAHSIPLTWFNALFDNGVGADMDALVIHPYTVPAEQLRGQIELLRQIPGVGAMPIEVTEFGTKDAEAAPSHLLKNYCQMALSGVTRVVWYPLNARGDGLVPLLDEAGHLQPVGQTYQMIAQRFVGGAVTDVAPDPFTYACLFGDKSLVIWGESRSVTLTGGDLQAVDVIGQALAPDGLTLSRDVPVVVFSKVAPIVLGENVKLGAQKVIADSVHQFAYPESETPDVFERFVRQGGDEYALKTRPGQEKNGVPWTPYLGTDRDGTARAAADWVLPSAWESGPLEIAYRYQVKEAVKARIHLEISPSERSEDGVVLTVLVNGDAVHQDWILTSSVVALEPRDVAIGDMLEFRIGPGGTARGDFSKFRVTILNDEI